MEKLKIPVIREELDFDRQEKITGNHTSGPLTSNFDTEEIKRLGKRFRKLDQDHSGSLSIAEVKSIPELAENPLIQRVMDIFDTDGNGEVDFEEFLKGLSQFSVNSEPEEKLKFAFSIYDVDKDGYISNDDLYQILKLMVGQNKNIKDAQLQQIVDRTFMTSCSDKNGKLSFEDFCKAVDKLEIQKKMVLDHV